MSDSTDNARVKACDFGALRKFMFFLCLLLLHLLCLCHLPVCPSPYAAKPNVPLSAMLALCCCALQASLSSTVRVVTLRAWWAAHFMSPLVRCPATHCCLQLSRLLPANADHTVGCTWAATVPKLPVHAHRPVPPSFCFYKQRCCFATTALPPMYGAWASACTLCCLACCPSTERRRRRCFKWCCTQVCLPGHTCSSKALSLLDTDPHAPD